MMSIVIKIIFVQFQVIVKGIHLVSIMGNQGTLTKSIDKILTDRELLYHSTYLVFCFSGICVHPFFFSVLVNIIFYLFIYFI